MPEQEIKVIDPISVLLPIARKTLLCFKKELTEERVKNHFGFRNPSSVKPYELPKLGAFNFVIDDVLDGGVNLSLNLDSHGKSLSYWLMAMEIDMDS